MRQKIVGMISSYAGLKPSSIDWLWHQSPYPFGNWGHIQMRADASQPDFLLLYQLDFPKSSQRLSWRDRLKGKTLQSIDLESQFRDVPRDRRLYLLREPPLEEVVRANQYNYEQANQFCAYVSGPDDDAPTPNYMPAIWYINNSFRELNEMPPPAKVKTCSWITSGISRTENHRKRLEFLRLLRSHPLDVDLFGRDLPDWSQAKGTISNKWHGMAPYYYNLAIENYADNAWYVSEKLWDALLSWCLPIYYGGSAADKLLPPGSFLRLPSLDEKGLQYIQDVTATPDAWYDAQTAIAEARQVILHKLNLLNWLSEFVIRNS
jgi:hypothetical protein